MWFSKVHEKLDLIKTALEQFINSQYSTVVILEKENTRLRKENARLLDRVMAVDYQKFQIYQKTAEPGTEVPLEKLSFLYDEENAGEIVDDVADMGRDTRGDLDSGR